MTPTPLIPSYLPETPSQTAGPYVHIGLIPEQAGFEIFENNFSGDIAGPDVAGERIIIEGRIFDGAGHVTKDVLVEAYALTRGGERVSFTNAEMGFTYRRSAAAAAPGGSLRSFGLVSVRVKEPSPGFGSRSAMALVSSSR